MIKSGASRAASWLVVRDEVAGVLSDVSEVRSIAFFNTPEVEARLG